MDYKPLPAYHYLTAKPLGSYRYRAAYGGRGSAKSWEFVDAVIFHAFTNKGLRVVFLREVQANLAESSMELVRERIKFYNLDYYFTEVNSSFVGKAGQKILFMGLWKGGKPEGIKSLEGANLVVLEEGTEATQKSLDVLLPTILRTPISEFWAIWNPRRDTDPIDQFFRGPIKPKKAIVKKTSYRDNPYFPEALTELMELDFAKDKARALWIWDGSYMPSVQGSIWSQDVIDKAWQTGRQYDWQDCERIVIGVDPSGGGDEVGIVVAGRIGNDALIIHDGTVSATSPNAWATAVARLEETFRADCIAAEKNFGGDMVKSTLEVGGVKTRIKMVSASKGKHIRAEPIAALYEQGKVKHLKQFPLMEAEMTMTTPDGYQGPNSPNRMDAMVWALTELMLCAHSEPRVRGL